MGKKVVTGMIRYSYFNGFKPRLNDLSGKTEFSTQILIPKSDTVTIAALKAAVNDAVLEKWGGKRPAGLRNPLRDGDAPVAEGAKELGPEYAGHYYFSTKASEDKGPQIVDGEGQPILTATEYGSGDYGRVSVTAFAYDQKVNKGVSFWWNNSQFLEKGEALDGRSDAATDFAAPIAKPKAAAPAVKKPAPKKAAPPPEDDVEEETDDKDWA